MSFYLKTILLLTTAFSLGANSAAIFCETAEVTEENLGTDVLIDTDLKTGVLVRDNVTLELSCETFVGNIWQCGESGLNNPGNGLVLAMKVDLINKNISDAYIWEYKYPIMGANENLSCQVLDGAD